MAFCTRCGKEIHDQAVVCVHCGNAVNNNTTKPAAQDSSSFGYGCLGFCIPIAGLILFLVWKNETPKRAKSAGLGALISTILGVVFYIIYFIVIIALAGSGYIY